MVNLMILLCGMNDSFLFCSDIQVMVVVYASVLSWYEQTGSCILFRRRYY